MQLISSRCAEDSMNLTVRYDKNGAQPPEPHKNTGGNTMNFLPQYDEVKRIADTGRYKALPVSCEILSDICTPIEALKILKNVSTHCYMLESVAEKEK